MTFSCWAEFHPCPVPSINSIASLLSLKPDQIQYCSPDACNHRNYCSCEWHCCIVSTEHSHFLLKTPAFYQQDAHVSPKQLEVFGKHAALAKDTWVVSRIIPYTIHQNRRDLSRRSSKTNESSQHSSTSLCVFQRPLFGLTLEEVLPLNLTWSQREWIALQLLWIVGWFHQHGMAHGRLELSNILLSDGPKDSFGCHCTRSSVPCWCQWSLNVFLCFGDSLPNSFPLNCLASLNVGRITRALPAPEATWHLGQWNQRKTLQEKVTKNQERMERRETVQQEEGKRSVTRLQYTQQPTVSLPYNTPESRPSSSSSLVVDPCSFSIESDLFSLGCLLYHLLFQSPLLDFSEWHSLTLLIHKDTEAFAETIEQRLLRNWRNNSLVKQVDATWLCILKGFLIGNAKEEDGIRLSCAEAADILLANMQQDGRKQQRNRLSLTQDCIEVDHSTLEQQTLDLWQRHSQLVQHSHPLLPMHPPVDVLALSFGASILLIPQHHSLNFLPVFLLYLRWLLSHLPQLSLSCILQLIPFCFQYIRTTEDPRRLPPLIHLTTALLLQCKETGQTEWIPFAFKLIQNLLSRFEQIQQSILLQLISEFVLTWCDLLLQDLLTKVKEVERGNTSMQQPTTPSHLLLSDPESSTPLHSSLQQVLNSSLSPSLFNHSCVNMAQTILDSLWPPSTFSVPRYGISFIQLMILFATLSSAKSVSLLVSVRRLNEPQDTERKTISLLTLLKHCEEICNGKQQLWSDGDLSRDSAEFSHSLHRTQNSIRRNLMSNAKTEEFGSKTVRKQDTVSSNETVSAGDPSRLATQRDKNLLSNDSCRENGESIVELLSPSLSDSTFRCIPLLSHVSLQQESLPSALCVICHYRQLPLLLTGYYSGDIRVSDCSELVAYGRGHFGTRGATAPLEPFLLSQKLATGSEESIGAIHRVYSLASSPNTVACGSVNGLLSCFDLEELLSTYMIRLSSPVSSGNLLSSNGQVLVSGCWNGSIHFMDSRLNHQNASSILKFSSFFYSTWQQETFDSPVRWLSSESSEYQLISLHANGLFKLWDSRLAREPVSIADSGGSIQQAVSNISTNGKTMVVGVDDEQCGFTCKLSSNGFRRRSMARWHGNEYQQILLSSLTNEECRTENESLCNCTDSLAVIVSYNTATASIFSLMTPQRPLTTPQESQRTITFEYQLLRLQSSPIQLLSSSLLYWDNEDVLMAGVHGNGQTSLWWLAY